MTAVRDLVDSGVEWLGQLPSDWTVATLGRECWVRARLGWKGLKADEYVCDAGYPMLSTPDIKGPSIDFQSAARITKARFDESPEIMLQVGDVLLTKDGSTIGTANIVRDLPEPTTLNGSIALLTPSRLLDGRYLYYVVVSQYAQAVFDRLRGGAGVPHLFQRDINRVRIPLPPLDEQCAIAEYLDHETSHIDALIAKQEEFIGLLHERRTATIGTATGWERELPDSWRRLRLLHLFKSTGSGTTPANDEILDAASGDVAWVTTSELREERIATTQRAISYSTVQKYSALKVFPAGTLLIAMYGATIGRTGILGSPAATNQACCALVGPVGASAEFVEYSIIAAREWLLLEASGGGQPNVNQEKVRSFRIPVPPLDEQEEIVAGLEEVTRRIGNLIGKTREHIALAKERRSALITAAVTGQIDVRTARKVS
ncbi:restriction endonuclease subunit S [Nesterenkonia sp. CF4.4]|uniref:restriction endonuclease subunit S n=1 Tax=Nesterenkonia sp. CF4.4 TaxID=3373079 RepID=UPI003EE6D238